MSATKPDRLMKKLMMIAAATLLMTGAFAQDDAKQAHKQMKHDAKMAKKDAKKAGDGMMADSAKMMKKEHKMKKKMASQ
ncbi:hypothetical protein GCM10028773_11630 [Spirosoma koreense]